MMRKKIISLVGYTLSYFKRYLFESLAVRFPGVMCVPKPLYVGLSVGTICNFRCRQCDLWKIKADQKNYLEIKEVESILISLRKWLGPFRLTFTGAEPLLRKDIFKILRFAHSNNIYTIITTNGWLVDKNIAKKLITSKVNVVCLSLDGFKAETHDFLRRKEGSHEQVIRALANLGEVKNDNFSPTIYINTVIMNQNIEELGKMIKIVQETSANFIRFQALESKWLFGKEKFDFNWFKNDSLWPKGKERIESAFEELISLKEEGAPIKNTLQELVDLKNYYLNPSSVVKRYKRCFTGVKNFAIDEYGKVHLCFGMRSIGNLRKQNPKEIWYGRKAYELRKKIAHCRRYCRILPCNQREDFGRLVKAFWKKLFSLKRRS